MSKNNYKIYLDKVLLPIPPSSIELTVNNKNETYELVDGTEINVIKKAGLSDIVLNDVLLPNVSYPFATYDNGFRDASYYLEQFEKMKTNAQPFQLIVVRTLPNGKVLYNTNLKVSMEDYSSKDDAENGFDVVVSINLKQYRDYGTKSIKIDTSIINNKPKVVAKPQPAPRPPSNNKKVTPGCNVIVNAQLHRDSYGSGPGQWRRNYQGKVNFVKTDGRKCPYHVTTPSGGWLGWVVASGVQVI